MKDTLKVMQCWSKTVSRDAQYSFLSSRSRVASWFTELPPNRESNFSYPLYFFLNSQKRQKIIILKNSSHIYLLSISHCRQTISSVFLCKYCANIFIRLLCWKNNSRLPHLKNLVSMLLYTQSVGVNVMPPVFIPCDDVLGLKLFHSRGSNIVSRGARAEG